jgi:hypothetical protein
VAKSVLSREAETIKMGIFEPKNTQPEVKILNSMVEMTGVNEL